MIALLIGLLGPLPAPPATDAQASATEVAVGRQYQPFDFEFVASDRDYDAAATGNQASPSPNPWLHLRLDVWLDHRDLAEPILVPGYFAGDGEGRDVGRVWRAHFTPPHAGTWTVYASLVRAQNINAAPVSASGVPVDLEDYPSLLLARAFDAEAPGFLGKGLVSWDGTTPYYLFSERSAGRLVIGGVGSPENLLGYAGFSGALDGRSGDGAVCCCKQGCFDDCRRTICANTDDPAPNFLHRYEAHVADWRPGDPDWSANGSERQGRGIIGALNYLADECRINSLYALVMNLGGDGKDTHPFHDPLAGMSDCPLTGSNFDPSHTLNYAVARLDQWRAVLEHANAKGIMVQLLLAEQEACNIRWFGPHDSDGGPRNHMGLERRLFMKQMVAHFGHLNGLRWNLCEENKADASCTGTVSSCGQGPTQTTSQFTASELDQMARWIRSWSQHPHPIGVHTVPNDARIYSELLGLPGGVDWLSSTSLQIHGEWGEGNEYEDIVRETSQLFAASGQRVPVINDEQGSPSSGLASRDNAWAEPTAGADDRRRRVLWDVMLSGGQVSYYFGYYELSDGGGDLRLEDFRTRGEALRQLGFARQLMTGLQIWRFQDADHLMAPGSAPTTLYGRPEVALRDDAGAVIVYYSGFGGPNGLVSHAGRLDLTQAGARTFGVTWFDASTGQRLRTSAADVEGGAVRTIALPAELTAGALPADADLVLVLHETE